MFRRALLGLSAAVCCLLAAPFTASAQGLLNCAGSVTLESRTTPHFFIGQDSPAAPSLPVDDYAAALEAAYARQVTEYGWWAPPSVRPDGLLEVVISGSGSGAGTASATGSPMDNPASGWQETDARPSCLVLSRTFADAGELQAVLAREVNRMVLFGVGAHANPAPDPVFWAGGPVLMEEETFPDANRDVTHLWPAFDDSLGAYDAAPEGQWLALRGLTERFGARQAGGAEQVLQDFWEQMSRGTAADLDALDAVLTARGPGLGQAFHDYAVGARAMRTCAQDVLPYCFSRAAEYVAAAGPRADHESVASTPGQASGQIEDDYAIQWIGLPSSAPANVTVANVAAGGVMQATATCSSGAQPVRVPFPTRLGAGQSATLESFPPTGCGDPAVVLTTASRTAANPATSTQRAYTVATAPPTATLTVTPAGSGSGLVASSPSGIFCGADCSETFTAGSQVTLGAAPAPGSLFAGWAGACSGTAATCTLTLSGTTSVVATFTRTAAPTGPSFDGPRITGDSRAPRLIVDRLRLSPNRRSLRLRVTCPASEPNNCSGFVALRARVRGHTLDFGEEAFVGMKGGARRTLTFPLGRRARAALARARTVRVSVVGRARDDAFNYATTKRTVALKLRSPRR